MASTKISLTAVLLWFGFFMLLFLVVGGSIWFVMLQGPRVANKPPERDFLEVPEVVVPDPEVPPEPVSFVNPTPWGTIENPDTELRAGRELTEDTLFWATKEGGAVSVMRRSMETGENEMIFTYTEPTEAARSGNLYEGLPPNIALDVAGTTFAFVDEQGLKTRDAASGEETALLVQTSEPSELEFPAPTWSDPAVEGTFSLIRPAFSQSGRYISIIQGHYEGGSVAVFDMQTKQFIPVTQQETGFRLGGGYYTPTWSPVVDVFLKPGNNDFELTGLWVTADTLGTVQNIAERHAPGSSHLYYNGVFSPDGQRIAFVNEDPSEFGIGGAGDFWRLGVSDADGRNVTFIEEEERIQAPTFSPDGEFVVYVATRTEAGVQTSTLKAYNIEDDLFTDLAILPQAYETWKNPQWTEDGLLMLEAVGGAGLNVAGERSRVFLLDLNTHEVVYASPESTAFASWFATQEQ